MQKCETILSLNSSIKSRDSLIVYCILQCGKMKIIVYVIIDYSAVK